MSEGTSSRWRRASLTLGILALGAAVGIGLMQGLIAFDEYSSTDAFCTSCHSMSIPAAAFRRSTHYSSRSGVRAQCGDCHVSEGVFAATWDHILGSRDLFAQLFGPDFNDPVIYDLRRPEMAFAARR